MTALACLSKFSSKSPFKLQTLTSLCSQYTSPYNWPYSNCIFDLIRLSTFSSTSLLLFPCTSVCAGQHRRISLMSSSTRLTFRGPETPSICFLTVAECPSYTAVQCSLSAIGTSLLLLPVLGTVCPPTCHVHTLYVCFPRRPQGFLFRRSFPWLLLQLLQCLRPCGVTVVILGHFNRFLLCFPCVSARNIFAVGRDSWSVVWLGAVVYHGETSNCCQEEIKVALCISLQWTTWL